MHVSSSHLKEVLKHEQGVQRMDLKKTKKKQCYLWSPTNKLVQKSVGYAKFQVPEHSRYRSIYIDWQRSYDE